jgi:uncharacterized protein
MNTLLERARQGNPLTGETIIDLHGHLGRHDFCIPDLAPGSLVAAMDRIGIESILLSHVRCLSSQPSRGNDEVLDAMQAFPGRILGYVILLPTTAGEVQAEMERRVAEGFTGLKLHSANGIPYDEPNYEPALAIANERRMPVLFHTWGEANMFRQIRGLAEKFPEASLILGHAGAANENEYIKIAGEFPNLFLDLTFSAGPRGLARRLVDGAGVDRVVFGSDGLFLSITQQIGKVLGADLTEDQQRQVLGGNARRILDRVLR